MDSPAAHKVKLNVDDACGYGNVVGCGGIIIDEKRNWLCSFSKFVGGCSSFMAELWSVFEA